MVKEVSYNERLFGQGFRAWLHLSRFRWLERKCARYRPGLGLVIELGCFDGRALSHLHGSPEKYYGFDANWEKGLDLAREKHRQDNFHFIKCIEPNDMKLEEKGKATLALSLETLEHIPPDMLDGYLEKLSGYTDGYVFITVPNEKGPVFLTKYLIKKIFSMDMEPYSFKEVFWATLGRTGLVERCQHKGFNYSDLHKKLKKFFDPVETRGIPFSWLPLFLNSQIGFVMKSR